MIGSAFERVRTRSAQKHPCPNAEPNYAFRFGQPLNLEPELGVQFSSVQWRLLVVESTGASTSQNGVGRTRSSYLAWAWLFASVQRENRPRLLDQSPESMHFVVGSSKSWVLGFALKAGPRVELKTFRTKLKIVYQGLQVPWPSDREIAIRRPADQLNIPEDYWNLHACKFATSLGVSAMLRIPEKHQQHRMWSFPVSQTHQINAEDLLDQK
ncbi:hypothetical protein GGX14DRAFT_391914 [Mycena pura]|uniref:Uncharacterized protein n=1 Tax=Mycena pura TaxID=153505 RepID=A0AAD6YI75_9AGAR|nr:hypothetical protein GGX14DRAFT_391914 [Mycena pura]